jgi:hypothetical protein
MDKILAAVFIIVGVVVVVSILTAFPLMLLWNWLMPDLFGLQQINFWQALGLAFLSNILFKSSTSNSSKN